MPTSKQACRSLYLAASIRDAAVLGTDIVRRGVEDGYPSGTHSVLGRDEKDTQAWQDTLAKVPQDSFWFLEYFYFGF